MLGKIFYVSCNWTTEENDYLELQKLKWQQDVVIESFQQLQVEYSLWKQLWAKFGGNQEKEETAHS